MSLQGRRLLSQGNSHTCQQGLSLPPEPSSRAERLAPGGGWADLWAPTRRETAIAQPTHSGSYSVHSEQADAVRVSVSIWLHEDTAVGVV